MSSESTLFDLLAIGDPEQVVYRTSSESITRKTILEKVYKTTNALQTLGISAGDRILLAADDSTEWVVIFWALVALDSQIILLSRDTDQLTLCDLVQKHKIQLAITDRLDLDDCVDVLHPEKVISAAANCLAQAPVKVAHKLLICFPTSGTNGSVKLVMHSSGTLLNCTERVGDFFSRLGVRSGDTVYTPAKMSFSLGFIIHILGALKFGATSMLGLGMSDLKNLNSTCDRLGLHHLIVTPHVLSILMASIKDNVSSTLRSVAIGAEPLPHQLSQSFQARFQIPLVNVYGLTEMISPATCEIGSHSHDSIGRPCTGTQLRIVDDHGVECTNGQSGILQLKCSSMFLGYLDDVASTQAVMREEWLHTNDVVYADSNGNIRFLGRANSCIKFKGAWVSLLEVENTILESEWISDCVVVQSRDERGFTKMSALVVAEYEDKVRLVDYLTRTLNKKYLMPNDIRFVPKINRTTNMKKIRNIDLACST
jgi:acyl-coenzyme A synthetase/AMP-(fatty) acid ligase